jgi:hypothetical protein
MFRKREKKTFPPGTFIATPVRIAAIIHLCLAFSLLLWIMSQPFMGDLFAVKSEMLLYDAVLSKPQLMEALPTGDSQLILENYELLKADLQVPFLGKIKAMFQLLFVNTAPLALAWLFFSFAIPLLLLLRFEGAVQACWLLPVIVFAYSIDNQLNAPVEPSRSDLALFPTEEVIVRDYLKKPLSPEIAEQQIELTNGWKKYLIDMWVQEEPVKDPIMFQHQLDRGEFAFTVARIKARGQDSILAVKKIPYKQSPYVLALYLFWNCLFASIAMRFLISRHLVTNCAAMGAPSLPNPPNRK